MSVPATVLSLLIGKTEHHVKNSNEFVKEIQEIKLDPEEELQSYEVSKLFMSVPMNKVLEVITVKLEEDNTLRERTPLEPDDIIWRLGLCLNCTYFLFRGEYYLQIHRAAMGSPISPIMCNLYIGSFEQKALATAPHQPRWCRYVDDTYTILKKIHSQEFIDHLSSVNEDIK